MNYGRSNGRYRGRACRVNTKEKKEHKYVNKRHKKGKETCNFTVFWLGGGFRSGNNEIALEISINVLNMSIRKQ
jgi:hypothetical protein